MTTPYEKIQNSFRSKFQSKTIIPEGLENEFFNSALGDFELDLYSLDWNEDEKVFTNALKRAEINLLGTMMYVNYLNREIDRIIKLSNIVGKDISLTGMGDSKRTSLLKLERAEYTCADMKSKLKTNTFYDEG